MRMKNIIVITAAFAFAVIAGAQNFSIDWWKIASGGGASTGATFSVAGTIGQHDTGVSTSATFSVSGGFWVPFDIVQTPGAPMLRIRYIGTRQAVVFWPVDAQGFTLQFCNDIKNPNWKNVGLKINDTATDHEVTVDATDQQMIFRLVTR
jgi:hypothetical protein